MDVHRVAQALERSPRRVQQLARQGVLPREAPGEYPLADCLTAHAEYLDRINGSGEIEVARARRTAAQAALREIDLAVEAGEMVEMELESERSGEQLTELRSFLLNLPSMAPRVVSLGRDRREELIREELERAVDALGAPRE